MNRSEIDLQNVNVYGIGKELEKYWKWILVFTISVWLFLTGFGQLLYTPEYTVSTTLVVTDKESGNTYASLSMASSMAEVMSEIFQSDAMRSLVESDTQQVMDGSVVCSQIQETNLIVLDIISQDPSSAYTFMNSALSHYSEVSAHIFANASLQVLQEPSIPTAPSNKPLLSEHKNILTLAAGAGMCVLIALVYILRYTVKTSTTAKNVLDGKILGVIPFEKLNKKQGKRALLLNLPIVSMAYSEAYRKLISRIDHLARQKEKKVLLVTSVSENEGKSTCAANMALGLQEKGKKVLLVDCDFIKPAQYKIFEEKNRNPYSIQYNKNTHIWELFLQKPWDKDPSRALKMIKTVVEEYQSKFDYILIDSSPTKASSDAEALMDIADLTLLVVRQDWTDIRVINDTVDLIWQSNSEFLGFVLNSFYENALQSGAYGYSHYANSERG